MKTTIKILTISAIAIFVAGNVFAAVKSSPSIPISANVDGTLTLSVDLRKNTPTGPGASVTAMNFGSLSEFTFTNPTTGAVSKTLRSSDTTGTGAFTAIISANSHQLPYVIKQTATPLTSGANSMPTGACVVTPIYATQDNGGAALVGTVGAKGSWVATDKVLYTSDAVGSVRTIQAIYSITDDPNAGASAAVPVNQAGGTYNSAVTFTVTA